MLDDIDPPLVLPAPDVDVPPVVPPAVVPPAVVPPPVVLPAVVPADELLLPDEPMVAFVSM